MSSYLCWCVSSAVRLILYCMCCAILFCCRQYALCGKKWLCTLPGRWSWSPAHYSGTTVLSSCSWLQVFPLLLGMYAPFVFMAGLGWCLESLWGVSVPLPPCLRACRSPTTPLGGRGLVVAAHRVVMVSIHAWLLCLRLHHLSRHLPQAHLLLMSLNVILES